MRSYSLPILVLASWATYVSAGGAILMWLDTRATTNDQKAITSYIKTSFNDNVEIDLKKVGVWHAATNYAITGWVISADYTKTVRRGVNVSQLVQSGIPTAMSNLVNPEYVKWCLTDKPPYVALRNLGYIPPTNRVMVRQ